MEFPTDRPLSVPEVHKAVAQAALAMSEDESNRRLIDMVRLVDPDGCAIALDLTGQQRQSFARVNRPTFAQIANRFVNRLVQAGIVERDWSTMSDKLYLLNPEKSTALDSITSLEGFSTLEFVETLNDPELRLRCEEIALRGTPVDTLVRDASTVLEDRLRDMIEEGRRPARRDLVANVLHPKSGTHPVGADADLQEDFFMLVRGLIGFYGTEVHHGLVSFEPRTARRVVAMIDEVLKELP